MNRQCAYCGKYKNLTKEHIWPKGLIKRLPDYKARYLKTANKVTGAELVIKDVCKECNNRLSALDDYLYDLYDRYFIHFPNYKDKIKFKIDSNKLLRLLLKITYNSARTTGQYQELLSSYKKYIIEGGSFPEDVSLLIHVVSPYIDKQNGLIFNPKSVRCGKYVLKGVNFKWLTLRVVAINSYYFYLVFCSTLVDEIPENELELYFKLIPGQFLSPDAQQIELVTSKVDAYDTHKAHFQNVNDCYKEYFHLI